MISLAKSEPRLPSRFEDLDEEFRGRLRPNKGLINLVKSAHASMIVEGGVRFAPIFGESGSGKSSATIQLGAHLPEFDVLVLSSEALENSEILKTETAGKGYVKSNRPLIAVIYQFEEAAAEKAAIPSNFVEKVAILDRTYRGRRVLFLWLTTSKTFQQQLVSATSRNTRILAQSDFEVSGPDRSEWPEIMRETFSYHNDGRDLADFEILDSDVADAANSSPTIGAGIRKIGIELAKHLAEPIDLSEFQVLMLWPVTDGIRIETLNRFAAPRQGYRINWNAFVSQLNPRDRKELPLAELNKARLYFDVRLVPIAAADLQRICGGMSNSNFKLSKSYLDRFSSTHFFSMVSKPDRNATFITLRERVSQRRDDAEAWYLSVTGESVAIGKSISQALKAKGLSSGYERTFDAGYKRIRADAWVERESSPKTTLVELKAFSPSNTRPSDIADAIRVTLMRHAQFAGFLKR